METKQIIRGKKKKKGYLSIEHKFLYCSYYIYYGQFLATDDAVTMKCKGICFCFRGRADKHEEESESSSHKKSNRSGKNRGVSGAATEPGHDHGGPDTTSSYDAGGAAMAAAAVTATAVSVSAMEGSGCGSSHGGGGGGDGC